MQQSSPKSVVGMSADILLKLAALGLTQEQMVGVLNIISGITDHHVEDTTLLDARRQRDRERKRRAREEEREVVRGQSVDPLSSPLLKKKPPPAPPKEKTLPPPTIPLSADPVGSFVPAAPVPLSKWIFDTAKALLAASDKPPRNPGSLINKWVRECGEAKVADVVQACLAKGTPEPVAYITAALRGREQPGQVQELFGQRIDEVG